MFEIIRDYIKEAMGGNSSRLSIRIPSELENVLKHGADINGMDINDYVRATLSFVHLPEILKTEIEKANEEWILNQGKEAFEIKYAKQANKLKKVKEIADFGLNAYGKFMEDVIAADVKIKNDINEKISKELK